MSLAVGTGTICRAAAGHYSPSLPSQYIGSFALAEGRGGAEPGRGRDRYLRWQGPQPSVTHRAQMRAKSIKDSTGQLWDFQS